MKIHYEQKGYIQQKKLSVNVLADRSRGKLARNLEEI